MVCKLFLSNSNIEKLNIAKTKDSSLCESINEWYHCLGKWEKWDNKLETNIYLDSKESVLNAENIQVEDYKFFCDFLTAKNILEIKRVYKCDYCVDLESKRNGLRFSGNDKYQLKEDFEYLKVERINKNWFSYTRDWN